MSTKYYLTGINRETEKLEIIHSCEYESDTEAKKGLRTFATPTSSTSTFGAEISRSHRDFEITKVIKQF